MKEIIKLVVGLFFAISTIIVLVLYLLIVTRVVDSHRYYLFWRIWGTYGESASNVPIFFGFCALAASYLLGNLSNNKT